MDAAEAKVIDKNYNTCGLGTVTKQSSTQTPTPTPTSSATPTSSIVPMAMLMTPVISVKDSFNSDGGYWVEIFVPGYVAGKADIPPIKGMLTKINKDDRGGRFLGDRCRLNSKDGLEWTSGIDIPVTPIGIYCPILKDIEFEFYAYAFLGELKVVSEAVRARVGNPVNITPTPSPTPSAQTLIVTPGAFCSPAGATGKSSKGVAYTCKTSPTDTKNRWRQ